MLACFATTRRRCWHHRKCMQSLRPSAEFPRKTCLHLTKQDYKPSPQMIQQALANHALTSDLEWLKQEYEQNSPGITDQETFNECPFQLLLPSQELADIWDGKIRDAKVANNQLSKKRKLTTDDWRYEVDTNIPKGSAHLLMSSTNATDPSRRRNPTQRVAQEPASSSTEWAAGTQHWDNSGSRDTWWQQGQQGH